METLSIILQSFLAIYLLFSDNFFDVKKITRKNIFNLCAIILIICNGLLQHAIISETNTSHKNERRNDSIVNVKKDSINNINVIQLKKQNSDLLESNSDVISANGKNINMLSRIDNYQTSIEEKTNKINLLQEEVQNIKDYSSVAKIDMLGHSEMNAGTNMSIESDLSIRMNKILIVNGSEVILNFEEATLFELNQIIEKYPKYPFGYYYKSQFLWRKKNPEWKKLAAKAIDIFEITTTMGGHSASHDMALRIIKSGFTSK